VAEATPAVEPPAAKKRARQPSTADAEVVGCAALSTRCAFVGCPEPHRDAGATTGLICSLFVLRGHRRRGVCAALLRAIVAERGGSQDLFCDTKDAAVERMLVSSGFELLTCSLEELRAGDATGRPVDWNVIAEGGGGKVYEVPGLSFFKRPRGAP